MITVAELLKRDSLSLIVSKNLYRKGEVDPYLQYLRKGQNGKHELSPSWKQFNPHELYLHPYFPYLDVQNIQCLYDGFSGVMFKMGQIIPGQNINGQRWFIIKKQRLALTQDDVYKLPDYFKPIYSEIASDYRNI